MTAFLLGFLLILAFSERVEGQCKGLADIVIAIPGSDDVPEFEFETFEKEITELLYHFKIQKTKINIGLVLYGNTQIRVASPQPFKTRKELNTRITLARRRKKYAQELYLESDVAGAIYAVHLMLLNPPASYPRRLLRPRSRKIGIIFTYGMGDVNNQAQIQLNVLAAAEAAHRDGILLYALSANGTVPGFYQIGDNDDCKLFPLTSYSEELGRVIPVLARTICSELDPKVQLVPPQCYRNRDYGKEKRVETSCIGDNVILADPNNCAYFYRCEFRKPLRHECPMDTLYDHNAKICNYAEYVECYSDIKCPKLFGLFPHPFDCKRFINCFNDIPYIQSCDNRTLFDEVLGSCNLFQHVACPPYKNIGPLP